MLTIKLPEQFDQIISQDTSIQGALLTLLGEFSNWLSDNKTEFFPEYTCHGIPHVQSVLNSASEIITLESYDVLTPQDIYVLTTSILLHDCAMHISKDSLWSLLTEDIYNGVLLGFDNEAQWSSRWNKFKQKIKRFDETDWHSFFGEYREIKFPDIGDKSLSDDQKIMIGDFVRQYHACIAQVISTHGIPTKNGPYQIFNKKFNYLNELSGFVARSHNHSLRTVVDILGDDRKREYRNTHPTFLMGVLRIADYLQFQSKRTPKILFKTKAFCSPISIQEWKKHLAIISTSDSHLDEELLFVEAFPEDANTLVGIKKMLIGFQKELDEFWAVNGEVHSRLPKLKKLATTYRRIKSNIDNSSEYVLKNHKSYHPDLLSIKSDNQKLLPLLIKPLYGDRPQVGIRELLQNATDACNERHYFETEDPSLLKDVNFNVTIEINFDTSKFIIQDHGIGMDSKTIEDFFLKIGASFRSSEIWKSKYTTDDSSHIPRTGKFGVGMLAGFLLGDRIEVETKHAESNSKAIKFSYELESKEIELRYFNKSEIGTKITIFSTNELLKIIEKSFDRGIIGNSSYYSDKDISSWWYFFDSPSVQVKVINKDIAIEKKSPYTIEKSSLSKNWQHIDNSLLDSIWWKFSDKPYVFCNGVAIKGLSTPKVSISCCIGEIKLREIELCLIDNNGNFPLNLTRDGILTNRFFELDNINSKVKKYFIEYLINIAKDFNFSPSNIIKILKSYYNYTFMRYYNCWNFFPLIFTQNEARLFTSTTISDAVDLVLVDYVKESQKRGIIYSSYMKNWEPKIGYSSYLDATKNADLTINAIYNFILGKKNKGRYTLRNIAEEEVKDKSNFKISNKSWLFIKEADLQKVNDDIKDLDFNIITVSPGWKVLTSSENTNTPPKYGIDIINSNDSNFFMFALYQPQSNEHDELQKLWDEYSTTE